ncbi:biotin--[acetyl-CoA-carboxylase] ligase [Pseudodesulfovibrio tunisiensis]|uniref:biotin--[acetyl-CoA-carboxylase] ligase n=1 Tax=Pseudodesulfovibrio tunisiensis TaxID=463192 RepID=UPI001FB51436|nr:biotin--[acetyl-CoA-carboxylase] ligase [Pseudodesulfovibrio tunisiensis]
MIPQGIFLLKNGIENMADPLDLAGLSAMHPSWEAAAATLEPGKEIADCGMSLTRCGRNDDSLVIVGPCQSTMDVGWELDRLSGLSDWSGVLAPDQQQGRGQLRRAWVSPPGNLHVTLCWPTLPEKGPWAKAMPDLLSIVAGWVICESFVALGAPVEMKWPNDLMQAGKKVGGMLIEEKKGRILLGLGVNLAFSPPEDLMRRNFAAQAGKMVFPLRPESPLALCRTLVGGARQKCVRCFA